MENPVSRGADSHLLTRNEYYRLYHRMKKACPKPVLCEMCKQVPPFELRCVGKYEPDLKNFRWMCRSCRSRDYYDKNPPSKGDNISKKSLRSWICKHKSKPTSGLCELCNNTSFHKIKNIIGVLDRDLNNWRYLCKSCAKKYGHTQDPRVGKKRPKETIEKMRATKATKECKERARLVKLGNKNPMWKDDDVGMSGLHCWINRNMPKPESGLCEICNSALLYDAACVTEIYNRDFENWKYLCRSCHQIHDFKMGFRSREKLSIAMLGGETNLKTDPTYICQRDVYCCTTRNTYPGGLGKNGCARDIAHIRRSVPSCEINYPF
jgi:hypothetical protein